MKPPGSRELYTKCIGQRYKIADAVSDRAGLSREAGRAIIRALLKEMRQTFLEEHVLYLPKIGYLYISIVPSRMGKRRDGTPCLLPPWFSTKFRGTGIYKKYLKKIRWEVLKEAGFKS